MWTMELEKQKLLREKKSLDDLDEKKFGLVGDRKYVAATSQLHEQELCHRHFLHVAKLGVPNPYPEELSNDELIPRAPPGDAAGGRGGRRELV